LPLEALCVAPSSIPHWLFGAGAEKIFDLLQIVLRVPPKIGAVVSGPAPCRGLGTNEAPAELKDAGVDLGAVEAGDVVADMGEVPLDGPQADGLEVKEANESTSGDLVSVVWGTVDHTR
jgi:hypothetical protein